MKKGFPSGGKAHPCSVCEKIKPVYAHALGGEIVYVCWEDLESPSYWSNWLKRECETFPRARICATTSPSA